MIEQEDCVHHWKIERPNGNSGWSTGMCIKCQAEKQFNNIAETKYSAWAIKREAKKASG